MARRIGVGRVRADGEGVAPLHLVADLAPHLGPVGLRRMAGLRLALRELDRFGPLRAGAAKACAPVHLDASLRADEGSSMYGAVVLVGPGCALPVLRGLNTVTGLGIGVSLPPAARRLHEGERRKHLQHQVIAGGLGIAGVGTHGEGLAALHLIVHLLPILGAVRHGAVAGRNLALRELHRLCSLRAAAAEASPPVDLHRALRPGEGPAVEGGGLVGQGLAAPVSRRLKAETNFSIGVSLPRAGRRRSRCQCSRLERRRRRQRHAGPQPEGRQAQRDREYGEPIHGFPSCH